MFPEDTKMEFERLKRLAGLTESDTLGAELKKAELERTTENEESPDFNGLLSSSLKDSGGEGFSFLKSLRKKPIDEAGDEWYDEAAEDARWQYAVDHFDEYFAPDYIKTEKGANEIFPKLLQHMHDGMVDAKKETETLEDWVLNFQSGWESFEDELLGEAGGIHFNFEWDDGRDYEYSYNDELKLGPVYEKAYALNFAKWAQNHQDVIESMGFSPFPDIDPQQFVAQVTSKVSESETDLGSHIVSENIDKDKQTLYNKVMDISANSNILDNGIMVGYVIEQLGMPLTEKNIALIESIIYKK